MVMRGKRISVRALPSTLRLFSGVGCNCCRWASASAQRTAAPNKRTSRTPKVSLSNTATSVSKKGDQLVIRCVCDVNGERENEKASGRITEVNVCEAFGSESIPRVLIDVFETEAGKLRLIKEACLKQEYKNMRA